MKIKKIIAVTLAMGMIFSLTSCKNNDGDVDESLAFADNTSATTTKIQQTTTDVSTTMTDETTTAKETTTASTTVKTDDPSEWSKAKIVEYYINACAKSSTVTSKQDMSLADISINNGEGAINSMFKLIKPIITKVLENNSTEFDGITGGHQNILVSDVASAKVYASGNNTVIEMTMYEQVDGAKSDRYSGTVGHAISVVGDISEVLGQLSDSGLPVEIADEDVTLTYTEPTFKVLIDNNGVIKNGTWGYLVDINLKNFKVGSVTVANASAVIKYVITVGGGFSN